MPVKKPPLDLGEGLAACHRGAIVSCAFGPRLAWAASGGWDGQVLLWDIETGQATTRWQAGPKPISALGVPPGGTRLWTGDMEGRLGRWLVQAHHQESMELAHHRPISSIAVAAHGRAMATSSWDGTIRVTITGEDGTTHQVLRGHADVVVGCQFWPDAKSIVSWSRDGTIRSWEVARGFQLGLWKLPKLRPAALAIAPDGRGLAVSTEDGSLLLWDVTQPDRPPAQTSGKRAFRGCFFTSDGQMVVAVSSEGEVRFLGVPDLNDVLKPVEVRCRVQAAALAPSGEGLALGSDDGSLYFCPLETLAHLEVYVTPTETIEERSDRSLLGRLRGQSALKRVLRCSCPVCGRLHELGESLPGPGLVCANCHRGLRFTAFTLVGA